MDCLGVRHDDPTALIAVPGQQFVGKWLQGPPLLQGSVLELVEKEVPYLLVQAVAQVVPAPGRVGPAQQVGDVVEPVRSGSALSPVERSFQELGQTTQGLSLAAELRGEIDTCKPARLTKNLDELRRDGLAAERVLFRKGPWHRCPSRKPRPN